WSLCVIMSWAGSNSPFESRSVLSSTYRCPNPPQYSSIVLSERRDRHTSPSSAIIEKSPPLAESRLIANFRYSQASERSRQVLAGMPGSRSSSTVRGVDWGPGRPRRPMAPSSAVPLACADGWSESMPVMREPPGCQSSVATEVATVPCSRGQAVDRTDSVVARSYDLPRFDGLDGDHMRQKNGKHGVWTLQRRFPPP